MANGPIVALTGATGFIGRHLLRELTARGYRVRVLLRRPGPAPLNATSAMIGDLRRPQNMSAAFADADAVIHSAGIAHAASGVPEDDYRALNAEATVALAQAAERAGVRRFVFLSSIRAQSGPTSGQVLSEDLPPRPTDGYGRSKLAAEQGLASLGIDWVAVRPVLVYGAGAKGNMARLLALARMPLPLPLGRLKARRSLLALDNLASAIDTLLSAPGPLRRPLIATDPGQPLTVPDMIAALRAGVGRSPGLIPMPHAWIETVCRLAGQSEAFERLAGGLVADATALRNLGWTPAIDSREGLGAFARATEARGDDRRR